MKIVCAGFWKTGTKSLAQALKILGYKVYDYDDQFFLLSELWDKFFDGTVTDDEIREHLKDVDVLIDGPVIAFWSEIHRAIPETKVILTFRDEDSWWKSFSAAVTDIPYMMKMLIPLMLLTPAGRKFTRNACRIMNFCQGVEGLFRFPMLNFTHNPRLYKLQYSKHNSFVMNTVTEEKLLVHQSIDGWKPLCKFLEEEVPSDLPYPHNNKSNAHFKSEGGAQNPQMRVAMIQVMVVVAIIVVLFASLVYTFMSYLL